LAPLLVMFVKRDRLAYWIGGLIVAAMAFRIALYFGTGFWTVGYTVLPSRADAPLIGMGAALAVSDVRCRRWLAAHTDQLKTGLQIALAGFVYLTIVDAKAEDMLMATVGHTIVALLALAIILAALFCNGPWLSFVLRHRYLTGLGGISYGVYLLHQPVYCLVAIAAGGRRVAFEDAGDLSVAFLAAVATVALARVSAVWFERPIQKFGYRVPYEKSLGAAQAA
jgi:peptidoglycan/LPS O-acetylase OafA/YrhL